ncbi:major head protein [Microcystis phage vB_MaeS-yong1]|nr:major head protein [Microcystis phage vB_MaeS-yong1]
MQPVPRTSVEFQLPGTNRVDPVGLDFPSVCELPGVGDFVHIPDDVGTTSEQRVFKVKKRVFLMQERAHSSTVVLVLE